MVAGFDYNNVDLEALKKDIQEVEKRVCEESDGLDQVGHFRKIELWSRLCSLLGYAALGWGINPIAWLGVGLGKSTRWMIIAHHISHKCFDRVKDSPTRYRSSVFASGWRRYIDWLDWMPPKAWHKEHNVLHHYYLNERFDPDVVEFNIALLRKLQLPHLIKIVIVIFGSFFWKAYYYAPSAIKAMYAPNPSYKNPSVADDRLYISDLVTLLRSPLGYRVFLGSYLPYIGVNFILTPLLYSLFGWQVGFAALCNMLLAEIVSNVHSFICVVPNHAGDDIYRFSNRTRGKGEFYLRQIVGSVNFRTGGDFNDFLHGWLNYQIEHHVWPGMTPNQYQRAQPLLYQVCKKHGIPYLQESVFRRVMKLLELTKAENKMLLVEPDSP